MTPHILLITMDELRRDALSSHGCKAVTTIPDTAGKTLGRDLMVVFTSDHRDRNTTLMNKPGWRAAIPCRRGATGTAPSGGSNDLQSPEQ